MSLSDLEVKNYIASHSDILETYGFDLNAARDHYLQYGLQEGRVLDAFDENQYLASHSDLLSAFGSNVISALDHYIVFGYQESREVDSFDEVSYVASHNDLLSIIGTNFNNAVTHYINYGFQEGREIDGFDENSYVASHEDLINHFSNDISSSIYHYIQYGFSERRILDNFDEYHYLASHDDLLREYYQDPSLSVKHYIHYGYSEGRSLDDFDAWSYVAGSRDLFNAFSNDTDLIIEHYVHYGFWENRSLSSRLEIGQSLVGQIDNIRNNDWISIELDVGNFYKFDMVGDTLEDPFLYLLDSNGNILVNDNDGGDSLNSRIFYEASYSGNYFLEAVANNRSMNTGSFTLSAVQVLDDYRSDNMTNGQLVVDSNVNEAGDIERTGDHDWFSIQLVSGEEYIFNVEGTTLNDPYLSLRDDNGILIDIDNDSGEDRNARIKFSPSLTATYFLDVSANNENSTGQYFISASRKVDDFEGDLTTSGLISVGESTSGELESAGDRDWFAVVLTSGNEYQFDLIGNTLTDTYLYLRDSQSLIISRDDDGGTGYNSQIDFEVTTSGTYYLDVGSYGNSLTGSYTISASLLPDLISPPNAPNPNDGFPSPSGFSRLDGYGQVNAERAFEQLLGYDLQNRPSLDGNLWALDQIGAPEVWNPSDGYNGSTGQGVTVAVIDTGVDLDHPEFSGRIVAGYDFVDNDTIADDGNGHGTHVAGTIAAARDDLGITGVAYDANIMPIRVLDDDGYGSTADIIAGIRWAADNGADVINLSLGGGPFNQDEFDAIEYATNQGSVVIMASGNEGESVPSNPANYATYYGIAVGAVDSQGDVANFSNRAGGTIMDYVTAPGVDIYSSMPNNKYKFHFIHCCSCFLRHFLHLSD